MIKTGIRRVGAMLLAAALAFGTARAEDADPVVVRVGDVKYTKSEIEASLQSDIDLSELLQMRYLTEEERAAQRDETIGRFIKEGLIECKLKEKGRNEFTKDEEATLRATARNDYETMWMSLSQMIQKTGQEATEEEITGYLTDYGYTVDAMYQEYLSQERRHRAAEIFCPDCVLTEERLAEFYETQFVEPDREKYENNLNAYEQEILALQSESFWTPPGYRAIRQILLEYPEEVTRALRNETARYSVAIEAVSSALQAVAEAAVTGSSWDDIKEPRAAYDEAAEELKRAATDLEEKREKLMAPLIEDRVKIIQAAYSAGSEFTSLIKTYSADKTDVNLTGSGYPVHPDSRNWPAEFSLAAAALRKPGDISEPVYTDMGVHILYYDADIPGGTHELTDEEAEALKPAALFYYQGLELDGLMDEWEKDYEIEVHPELLED